MRLAITLEIVLRNVAQFHRVEVLVGIPFPAFVTFTVEVEILRQYQPRTMLLPSIPRAAEVSDSVDKSNL